MTAYKYLPIAFVCFLVSCAGPQVEDRSRFNDTASITVNDAIPVDPLQWKALNSFTDTALHTQATLYANDSAYQSARTGGTAYPAGAQLVLVTWAQQDDPHWLGARIAGGIKSVELITFENSTTPHFSHYEGHPLKAATGMQSSDSARVAWALKQPVLSVP